MSLNYSLSLRKNRMNPDEPAKAYATAQSRGTVALKSLSQAISMQTTVSRADVLAVITSLEDNIRDSLRAGYMVELGDLGRLRVQLVSEGAPSMEEFTSDYIVGVNIRFTPGKELKNLFFGMSFDPVPTRAAVAAVLKAQKSGQNTVDISSGGSGGSSQESLQESSPEDVLQESSPEEGADVIN